MSDLILEIKDLHASVDGQPILRGVNLTVPRGEVHALMGPNGSGKPTLANTLMGHPAYEITTGRIIFKGVDVTEMDPDERARRGMFLAFQYPVEVPGVSVLNFLRTALGAVTGEAVPPRKFRALVSEKLEELGMDMSFARRNLNEGFSGGEKKRCEVLQLSLLRPELAILDETDSGLDVDAIRLVGSAVVPAQEGRFAYQTVDSFNSRNRVRQEVTEEVVKRGGGRYRVSAWMRIGSGKGAGKVGLSFAQLSRQSGARYRDTVIIDAVPLKAGEWVPVAGELVLHWDPEKYDWLRSVHFQAQAQGKLKDLYIDNCRLESLNGD